MIDKETVGISLFEWGLLIAVVGVIDLIQLLIELLDLTGVGALVAVVVTGLIDICVGFGLFMYCLIRGISLTPARVTALLGGFLLELLPVIGGAPLWSLDVIYLAISVRAEEGKFDPFSGAVTGAALGALVGGPAGIVAGGAAGILGGKVVKDAKEGKGGVVSKTASKVLGAALGAKGGLSKAGAGTKPPVINQKVAPSAVPPKIPDGRQPLPRRIPQEPGVGEL